MSQKEISKTHYEKNKAAYKARNRARKEALKQYIREAKAAPCMDCGMTYPPYVMDFDHRDPTQKVDGIANAPRNGWSYKKLDEEIAKCDLVCANCHRIRTHQ